jgi:hypothetical protein
VQAKLVLKTSGSGAIVYCTSRCAFPGATSLIAAARFGATFFADGAESAKYIFHVLLCQDFSFGDNVFHVFIFYLISYRRMSSKVNKIYGDPNEKV